MAVPGTFPYPGPPLVGRERERAMLHGALDTVLAGRGALVLIGGEAGVGKTALAEATLAEAAAARGALVLVGRCYDLTETPPYGPWAEALTSASRAAGLPPPPDLGGGSKATSQAALFAAVRDYLVTLTQQRPVVLLLDDLHWADPASLDLLRFLARQLSELGLLLLATYRADELTRRHPLYALLPVLEREARAARLDLRPLGAAALHALVGRYALPEADAARLVAWLLARAEGNAFFTTQLLRALEDEGTLRHATAAGWTLGDLAAAGLPSALRQVLDARLDRLGEDARHLLTLAAVVGQEVPLTVWAAVGELAEDALLDHAERAIEARLLAESPDGAAVRFPHALIREALYEGVLALRRRALHRRAGEALMAAPHPDPDAVANHLQRAGDPRAAEWLERAGERAQRAYAWVTAAERYAAALAVLEAQGGVAARRGWLAFHQARLRRFADARRALGDAEAAARLAREAGDPLLAAVATQLAGILRCFLGEVARGLAGMAAGLDALAALPAAARVLPGAGAPLDPDLERGTVVSWLGQTGRYAEAVALGARYLAEVPPPAAADWLGGHPYANAHSGLALAAAGRGQPGEARRLFARARELNGAIGHHHVAAWVSELELYALVLAYEADRPAGRRRLLAEVEEARVLASGVGASHATARAQVGVSLVEGRWEEAWRVGSTARAQTLPIQAVIVDLALGRIARARGEAKEAWAAVRATFPAGPAAAPGDHLFPFAHAVQRLAADAALDAGDLAVARAWLSAHDRWLAWSGTVLGQADGHLGWAAYNRAAGNPDLAREHAAAALAHAADPRQPLALLAAHRLNAELDTEAGDHADARAHLDQALALADACAAPYERALTLLALAELHAASGDRDAATPALAEARAILEPLEARPALARADALVQRLGTSPRPPAPGLPFGLSLRETEVLRLVAEGLSDAQVAERLFLSPYTVKAHLRSIYGKLGVPSRAAATRLAVQHDLA